ncbi:hypothetical protein [uncultured Ruminococcus sp.]|uniref:hypothetical protein n=1 Tax=uncultured Ruminococcus sp. TaxID=165186 RepID=UPI002602E3F4|nr:hypothetical protein [uncultured Ruminococcus sp.]
MAQDAKNKNSSVLIPVLLTAAFIFVILLSVYGYLYLIPRSTEEYYHRLVSKFYVSASMENAKKAARLSVRIARAGIAVFGTVDVLAAVGSFLCIRKIKRRGSAAIEQ